MQLCHLQKHEVGSTYQVYPHPSVAERRIERCGRTRPKLAMHDLYRGGDFVFPLRPSIRTGYGRIQADIPKGDHVRTATLEQDGV